MEEKKYTMAELQKQLKDSEADRNKRIQKFIELLKIAEKETNCTLQIDFNSPINDIKILVVSKT